MTRHGARGPLTGPLTVLLTGLLTVLLAGLLAACGSAPGTVDPSGVDGLVVPSPTPDPADFVAGIDNPWLPLEAGAGWEYEVVSEAGTSTLTVSVARDTREVAGVEATPVTALVTGAAGSGEETVTWYAQDDGGNVWVLGVQGEWTAGVDGTGATLAMPAEPRLGDGFVTDHVDGVEHVARIDGTGSSVTVPAGRFTELLDVRLHPRDDLDEEAHAYYARGVGRVVGVGPGGSSRTELVRHTPGG